MVSESQRGTDALGSYATARDLTIEAAQSASAVRSLRNGSTTRRLPTSQIKKLLDSRNERDVLDGLRRVISVREQVLYQLLLLGIRWRGMIKTKCLPEYRLHTQVDDVSVRTMSTAIFIGYQECGFPIHGHQEARLYLPPPLC